MADDLIGWSGMGRMIFSDCKGLAVHKIASDKLYEAEPIKYEKANISYLAPIDFRINDAVYMAGHVLYSNSGIIMGV